MDMLTEHHRLARVRSMHKELAIIVLGLWPLVMHAMQNPPDHRDIDFYELAPSSLGYGLHHAFTESGFKSMAEGEITVASSLPEVYRSVIGLRHVLSAVMRVRPGGVIWSTVEPTWATGRDMGKTAENLEGNWAGLGQYWDLVVVTAVLAAMRGVHYAIEVRKDSTAIRVEPLHAFLTTFHISPPVLYNMGAFGHATLLPMRLYTSWDCGSFLAKSRADAESQQGTEPRRDRYKAAFAEHPPALCTAIVAAYTHTKVPSRSIADHLGLAIDVDRCQWHCSTIIESFYTGMVDVKEGADQIRAHMSVAVATSTCLDIVVVNNEEMVDTAMSCDVPAGQPDVEEYNEADYVTDCIGIYMANVNSAIVVDVPSDSE